MGYCGLKPRKLPMCQELSGWSEEKRSQMHVERNIEIRREKGADAHLMRKGR
jgi:hypothetical protein